MSISQPSYPVETDDLVTHVGSYVDARETAEVSARNAAIAAHTGDSSAAHAASAISVTAIDGMSWDDVQEALQGIKDLVDALGGGGGATEFATNTGLTFSGTHTTTIGTETWASSVASLTANHVETLAGRAAGKFALWRVKQDATGGRTFSVSDGTTPVSVPITSTANAVSLVLAFCPNSTDIDVAVLGGGGGGGSETDPNAILKSVIDAAGDIVVGTGADTAGRLAIGSNGNVLTVSGGALAWATPDVTQAELDAVAAAKENTGVAIPKSLVDAAGDLLVGTANDTVGRLAKGSDTQVLTVTAGAVGWAAPSGGGGSSASPFIFRTGRYYEGGNGVKLSSSNGDPIHGRYYAMPFFVGESTTFDRIGINVVSVYGANGIMRFGIAADTGDGYPGALIDGASLGTVTLTSTGARELTISQTLSPGMYWLLSAVQEASGGAAVTAGTVNQVGQDSAYGAPPMGHASIGVSNGQMGYQTVSIAGEFASSYPAGISSTTTMPRVMIRAA